MSFALKASWLRWWRGGNDVHRTSPSSTGFMIVRRRCYSKSGVVFWVRRNSVHCGLRFSGPVRRYRIQRIEQLTGRSLAKLEDRVDFFLAL
jgi:hypothetical protein